MQKITRIEKIPSTRVQKGSNMDPTRVQQGSDNGATRVQIDKKKLLGEILVRKVTIEDFMDCISLPFLKKTF